MSGEANKGKISKDDVKHLANLAQLELTEEELKKFSGQLTGILQYVNKINEVELSDNTKRSFENLNSFREDEDAFEDGEHREAIIEAFPESENNMLKVKKILDN